MSSSNAPRPVSVLFVCLGNICRSTMAEGVFRHLAQSNPAIGEIDSSGTGAYHTDEPPDSRTMSVLEDNGITDYVHGARKVTTEDFTRFDYILAMDRYNLRDLERMRRRAAGKGQQEQETSLGKTMLFGDFGGSTGEEVVDPYYGARDGFEIAYEQMVRFSKGLLAEVENGNKG
ncbi:MAG: hypothetical protein M4579_004348 [Chaenotheca gracillima]|nr:MAG: hypothetical protein M4579_004348 [Chaenotheca gracillima]